MNVVSVNVTCVIGSLILCNIWTYEEGSNRSLQQTPQRGATLFVLFGAYYQGGKKKVANSTNFKVGKLTGPGSSRLRWVTDFKRGSSKNTM